MQIMIAAQTADLFLGVPEYIWENIFAVINTLVCGMIVALFTSTFLKKKEERTRIAGVIVEKRINSEQEILHFLEKRLFKEELNIENSSKYDKSTLEILHHYHLPVPHEGHAQYAQIFLSTEEFDKFFHEYEDEIMKYRLWLDTRVRTHLVFLQMYFSTFNSIPLIVKRIPLPKGQELTDEEFMKVCDRILWILGVSCDAEINSFLSELDEYIVDSVYKLELKRPRKSILRNRMYNVDIKKCYKRIMKKTIPGVCQENVFALTMDFVYAAKNIDIDAMTDDEYDAFIDSADPQMHEQMKAEVQAFKDEVEKIVEESGAKIVSRADMDKYPGYYGISLRDILEGKEIDD